MAVNLPSINVPFTDRQGRINPIWHEFLRSFVAETIAGTISAGNVNDIVAGNGLVSSTEDGVTTFRVGQGSATAVNADDVAVNIHSQTGTTPALDDEILINDVTDNNEIRKTSLRDVGNLIGSVPGGGTSQIQYNNDGFFGGDSGFTTNGTGSIDIVGDLSVDNVNIDGNTVVTTDTNGDLVLNPNGTGTINAKKHIELDTNIYIYGVGGVPSNGPRIEATSNFVGLSHSAAFPQVNLLSSTSNSGSFLMMLGNSGNIRFASDDTGLIISNGGGGAIPLRRSLSATLSASVSQTQGSGALTADINEISTVSNANDSVTLPAALAGRHCLVINSGTNILQIFPASGDNLGQGLNTSTTLAAGSKSLFIAYDTTNWRPIFGEVRLPTEAGITASTTQTQGQRPLVADVNEIATCANTNDTVTLPAAAPGRQCLVINNGAETLQVFPASGDDLGAGADTATTIVATSRKLFISFDSTNWEPVL